MRTTVSSSVGHPPQAAARGRQQPGEGGAPEVTATAARPALPSLGNARDLVTLSSAPSADPAGTETRQPSRAVTPAERRALLEDGRSPRSLSVYG